MLLTTGILGPMITNSPLKKRPGRATQRKQIEPKKKHTIHALVGVCSRCCCCFSNSQSVRKNKRDEENTGGEHTTPK